MRDVLVTVPAVDVQQVDAAVEHEAERLVEGGAQHGGEAGVVLVVKLDEVGVDVVAVEAGVFVAAPGVDCKRACVHALSQHGLAEGGVGDAVMRAELDDAAGAVLADDPVCERDVAEPGAVCGEAGRAPEERGQFGGGECFKGVHWGCIPESKRFFFGKRNQKTFGT